MSLPRNAPPKVVPPFRFATVEVGVYRGAYPTLKVSVQESAYSTSVFKIEGAFGEAKQLFVRLRFFSTRFKLTSAEEVWMKMNRSRP